MYEYDQLVVKLTSILDGDILPLPRNDLLERNEQRVSIAVCEAMRMTPEHWKGLNKYERKPWIERTIERLVSKADSTPEVDDGEQHKAPSSRPKVLLTGWHEIAQALGKRYSEHNDIKSLNKRYQGPITNRGKGTKPMVYQEDLLSWWDRLAVHEQELANQRNGARMSAETQYNYGREGTVVPELGGGVKRRRRPKQT